MGTDRRLYKSQSWSHRSNVAAEPTTGPTHSSAACDEHQHRALAELSAKDAEVHGDGSMLRDGCKLVDFDATLGCPGEGPDSGVQRMHAALAEAAKQACTDDVVRKQATNTRCRIDMGAMLPLRAWTLSGGCSSHTRCTGLDDINTSSLWAGDDMTQIAEAEEGFWHCIVLQR